MKRFGLSTLIHPHSVSSFTKKYWPGGLFVSHGSLNRFPHITAIPELSSAETLMASWKGTVNAWAPKKSGLPDFKAEPHQLLEAYQKGYTLYFRHVEEVLPALQPLARAMERDLGLQEGNIFCDAFASRGTGAAPHFDPDMSFNLQLVGSKEWTFAKNEHVTFPLVGASMHQDVPEELKAYSRLPFPQKMPARSTVIPAKKGTLFFIPHGMWHTTRNFEPSLLFSFTVLVKCNAQMLADEFYHRLRLREPYRDRSGALTNAKIGIKKRGEYLSTLLQGLKDEIDTLDTDGLLMKWAGRLNRFYGKTPGAKWKISTEKGSRKAKLKISSGRKNFEKIVPSEAIPVFRWIAGMKTDFSGQSAVDALRRYPARLVVETLNKAVKMGLLNLYT